MLTRCVQEEDVLQDDSDGTDVDVSAASAVPLDAAARTALLRQLPPELQSKTQAATAAAGGADVEALQTALEVCPSLWEPGDSS